MRTISRQDGRLAIYLGLLFFSLYLVLLYFRPEMSWYDETYWTDLGRQIGINGKYFTTVWGGGQPSYSPLYAFVLAAWFKVFGFSFMNAHIPPLIMALASYYCLVFPLLKYNVITGKKAVITISSLFWLSPHIFYSFNCGRVEPLCILTGILTVLFFIENCDKGGRSLGLFISSFLLMATGFQGCVFATLIIFIFLLLSPQKIIARKKPIVIHISGYLVSLISVCFFMWRHNCLRAFFRTTFGFSNTVNVFDGLVNLFSKGSFDHNDITFNTIKSANSFSDVLSGLTINGLIVNKEYIIISILILVLLGVMLIDKRLKTLRKMDLCLILSAFAMPFAFIILGRYATYYAWTPYIPCICAFTILIGKMKHNAIWHILSILIILIWFVLCPYYPNQRNFDFTKTKDDAIRADIIKANINPEKATYIPYEWYYYLIQQNENLYFRGSGFLPKENLDKMIISPPYSELVDMQSWLDYAELEMVYMYDIGDKKVYILSKRTDGDIQNE